MTMRKQVVICGAGIAGISAAYFLMKSTNLRDIALIDDQPPLSLTSDKSTECYRNWWPSAPMTGLINRSVALLQELADSSQNQFLLNQRGYLYATADEQVMASMLREAELISTLAAGPLRRHPQDLSGYPQAHPEGYWPSLDGADWISNPDIIHTQFPYLNPNTKAVLHVRKAGWFSAQQLGMTMLAQCRQMGMTIIKDRVAEILHSGGRITGATLESGETISCETLVLAAGPFSGQLAKTAGLDLPITNELHLKASIRDPHEAVPRHAPLVIWKDSQHINWAQEETEMLNADPETAYLTQKMSGGCHTRPEGGPGSQVIIILWEYKTQVFPEPVFPPPLDPFYPEIALRGMATAIPKLAAYIGRISRPWIDGGYYTRTLENRPLICPLPLTGGYLSGAFSGFGLMAACAAGELLACHYAGSPLPDYAHAFHLDRYQDPEYLKTIQTQSETGQL